MGRLVDSVKSRKLPAVLTFIDFKKAFDSVYRGKMLKILTGRHSACHSTESLFGL